MPLKWSVIRALLHYEVNFVSLCKADYIVGEKLVLRPLRPLNKKKKKNKF